MSRVAGCCFPSLTRRSLEEELHVNHVMPLPELESDFPKTPYQLEPHAVLKSQAGRVFCPGPGDESLVASSPCPFDFIGEEKS